MLTMPDDPEPHGTRTIREDGSIRLPDSALDRLDLAPGDEVRLFDTGEEIVAIPWTEDAIRELADDE